MTYYLTLFKHTTEAKENIDDVESWLEAGMDLADEVGTEVHDVYFGNIGEYDAMVISEAPDELSVEQVRVAFESRGTHELETYPIFEADEYVEMVDNLPV